MGGWPYIVIMLCVGVILSILAYDLARIAHACERIAEAWEHYEQEHAHNSDLED